jgi:glucuronyl/N-acetylglucosaminyl transferase EXT2
MFLLQMYRVSPQSSRKYKPSFISNRRRVCLFSACMYAAVLTLRIFLHASEASETRQHLTDQQRALTTNQDQQPQYSLRRQQNASASQSIFNLDPIDYNQYTVRINSWKRQEVLQIAVQHYLTCGEAVAQIQIVWCSAQGDPPAWLLQLQARDHKVFVELHDLNSLNERFHVLQEPPTRGVLTVDDDVLRPCLALDAGFFKWTQHPDRMVGYDARAIVDIESMSTTHSSRSPWMYGYLATTKETNQYGLALSRFAFVHVDHMKTYMTAMPQSIRDKVQVLSNCEDIAMSLWVSSRTDAKVPLLADNWAIQSLVKLHSNGAISLMSGHKQTRDNCVNEFARALGLLDTLHSAGWIHEEDSYFDCGVEVDEAPKTKKRLQNIPRFVALQATISKWKTLTHGDAILQTKDLIASMNVIGPAYDAGLVFGTKPWRQRFKTKAQCGKDSELYHCF